MSKSVFIVMNLDRFGGGSQYDYSDPVSGVFSTREKAEDYMGREWLRLIEEDEISEDEFADPEEVFEILEIAVDPEV